ncbi:MAG TPA: ABC transporter ATP-binding protein, partial [Burkholderiaceae bacterium]|nr:ABC transporter ATP-binding protein [Burkholderiaceae bacterium]
RRGIADALYLRLSRASLSWHDRHHSGDLQQRLDQASHALFDFTQTQFIYLQNAINLLGPLVALTLLSHSTGMLALVGYLLIAAVIVRFDKVLMQLAERENQAQRRYASRLLDFVGNIGSVASLRLQEATRHLLDRRLLAVFEPLRRSIVLTEVKWCAVDLLTISLSWGLVVAYAWSASSAAGSAVMLGSLFMIYQYAQQAASVVGSIAGNYQNYARIRTNFATADAIWQAPQRDTQAMAIEADWQHIQLRDIGFAHGARQGAQERGGLQSVNLEFRRGERIALVGPSGSGKSTLLRVLAGLYDAERGHIDIDGVARLGLKHLGPVATLIPQEAEVFEASVRENIALDQPIDDTQLAEALHASAFDIVLQGMPDGLDTHLSERGGNLSGGQRQRLALARGLLAARGSSLLLLDEPTSALDPLTELRVHQRIDDVFQCATIVASVHRMSLLAHFDRVALMVAGRVADVGTIEELLERQPLFAQMLQGAAATATSPAAIPHAGAEATFATAG